MKLKRLTLVFIAGLVVVSFVVHPSLAEVSSLYDDATVQILEILQNATTEKQLQQFDNLINAAAKSAVDNAAKAKNSDLTCEGINARRKALDVAVGEDQQLSFVPLKGPNKSSLYVVKSQVVAVTRAKGVGVCETVIFTTASNPLYVCDSPEQVIAKLRQNKAQTEQM